MLRQLLIVFLATATVLAQSPAGQKKSSTPAKRQAPAAKAAPSAKGTAVPASEPVLTLHGLCASATDGLTTPAPGSSKGTCVSTISKAQFETLLRAVNPNLAPALRRNIAQQLVEFLAMAQAAGKAGVQKQPDFPESMKVQKLEVMGKLYARDLDEQLRHIPPAEIAAYYKQHQDSFEEAKLRRVYVPKIDPTGKSTTAEQKSAYAAKAKKVADDMQARAAKGEDMDKLQKEAYATLGVTTNPPPTELGGVRKGALSPAADKAVFALKPGGVYKSDEPTAYLIYKVDSKQQLTEDAVKDEISRTLYQQKAQGRRKQIADSVKADYNDKYFGSAATPGQKEHPSPATPGGSAKK